MNKLNNFLMFLPMIFNILIILIMMMPSKINKFHPITLMITLILLTFFICLKINFLKKSMIPFILFLIMIGSLMVIFLYITSLANNELFSFNLKFLLMNIIKIFPLILIFIIFMYFFKQLINFNNIETFQIFKILKINQNMNINILYKESNNKSSFFTMLYLYYSMICIMNICYKFKAPLRQLMF